MNEDLTGRYIQSGETGRIFQVKTDDGTYAYYFTGKRIQRVRLDRISEALRRRNAWRLLPANFVPGPEVNAA